MGTMRVEINIPEYPRLEAPGLIDRIRIAITGMVPSAELDFRYTEKIIPPKEEKPKE